MPENTKEQQIAIAAVDKHVLVSAGAGSGKTYVLVEHYLEILRQSPEASVFEIIAVTFTRKAADEMRSRLKIRLKQMAGSCPQEEQELWTKHLSEIDGAKIGTIHSLCENILKSFPAESKVDPAFQTLDELEGAELLEESLEEAIHELMEDPSADALELLDYSVETIKQWLTNFLKSPIRYKDSCALLADFSKESIRQYAAAFVERQLQRRLALLSQNSEFKANSSYILNNIWPNADKLFDKQQETIALLTPLLDDGRKSPQERWQTLNDLAEMKLSTAGGAKGETLKEAIKAVRNYAKELDSPLQAELNAADDKSFAVLSALLKLSHSAFVKYERLKQAQQKLDYDDLISKTSQLLLSENSSVRKYLSANLRAVLIDEFQDTNWTQVRLLSSLAGTEAKLFLIGDDKQSIYKFQGADVGVFNTFKDLIASLEQSGSDRPLAEISSGALPELTGSGQALSLSMSFRSHPQIVEFINYVFEKLLKQKGQFSASFQRLEASREGDSAPRIEVIRYEPEPEMEGAPQLDAASLESQLIANWIQEKINKQTPLFDKELNENRPLRYGDIAVLVPDNDGCASVEWALNRAEIPYVTYAGKGYLERQEIYDLENLLKWLACEQDSHALFAVLRSPMFGFSDDLLHRLTTGHPGSLWSAVNTASKSGPDQRLRRAHTVLKTLLQRSRHLNLAGLVKEILAKTHYDMILLALPGGRQRSRNVFKFLTLATKYNHLSLTDFLHSLQSLRDLNVRNLTDAPLNADNAVKIMTIHGSKGLEFGAVALARLSKMVHRQNAKLLFGKDYGITLDGTKDSEEEKPAFYLAASHLNKEMEEEEKKRLLYVALTRSRDYLAVFYRSDKKFKASFAAWLESALELSGQEMTEPETVYNPPDYKMPTGILLREPPTSIERPEKERDAIDEMPMSASILEQIYEQESAADLPSLPWQSLLRISPNKEGFHVHPTILGSYFHLLMSEFSGNNDEWTEEHFQAYCLHHEIGIWHSAGQNHLIQEGKRLLNIFMNSPLKELMLKAQRRIHEQPYALIEEGKLQREYRPDLIIEDEHGDWHIIDYKTDHFDQSKIEEQARLHSEQLADYASGFARLSGHEARTWLYFAQFGIMHATDSTTVKQLTI